MGNIKELKKLYQLEKEIKIRIEKELKDLSDFDEIFEKEFREKFELKSKEFNENYIEKITDRNPDLKYAKRNSSKEVYENLIMKEISKNNDFENALEKYAEELVNSYKLEIEQISIQYHNKIIVKYQPQLDEINKKIQEYPLSSIIAVEALRIGKKGGGKIVHGGTLAAKFTYRNGKKMLNDALKGTIEFAGQQQEIYDKYYNNLLNKNESTLKKIIYDENENPLKRKVAQDILNDK